MAEIPETKYARLGGDRIAYQVLGEGPIDLLHCPGTDAPIDTRWEYPPYAAFQRRLASLSRLILFDRRGTGASDPSPAEGLAAWENWADDARAVMDTVGSQRAVFFAHGDGGPTGMLFAATDPDRTQALILFNTTARFLRDDDYPYGLSETDVDTGVAFLEDAWGTEAMASWANPDVGADPDFAQWWAKAQRATYSPRHAAEYFRWVQLTDVRQALPAIRAPTLVLHRKDVGWITADQGQYLAERIPGAQFVALNGANLACYSEPNADVFDQIGRFVRRVTGAVESDRALAAVLFTDIVASTERAAALGDSQWRDLIQSHDVVAKTLIAQHRGRLVKTTGDGILATFDGPGRAIRFATALRDALRPLGIEIRAGLHTGEVEHTGADITGIAVHVAARVCDDAGAGEVLVSGVVPVLVAGSGLEFEDRGEHELKGVPGSWRLFAVIG